VPNGPGASRPFDAVKGVGAPPRSAVGHTSDFFHPATTFEAHGTVYPRWVIRSNSMLLSRGGFPIGMVQHVWVLGVGENQPWRHLESAAGYPPGFIKDRAQRGGHGLNIPKQLTSKVTPHATKGANSPLTIAAKGHGMARGGGFPCPPRRSVVHSRQWNQTQHINHSKQGTGKPRL